MESCKPLRATRWQEGTVLAQSSPRWASRAGLLNFIFQTDKVLFLQDFGTISTIDRSSN